jgi:hypothetical protein
MAIIAEVQFAATCVRFDFSFAVARLARFCASEGISHWATLHHVMEYLEAHQSFKLTYRKRSALSNGLTGFADSDWAMSLSRRSTTGDLFLYNRSQIAWRSKMQKTIALRLSTAIPADPSIQSHEQLEGTRIGSGRVTRCATTWPARLCSYAQALLFQ